MERAGAMPSWMQAMAIRPPTGPVRFRVRDVFRWRAFPKSPFLLGEMRILKHRHLRDARAAHFEERAIIARSGADGLSEARGFLKKRRPIPSALPARPCVAQDGFDRRFSRSPYTRSANLYPTRHTVSRYLGCEGLSSIFSRIFLMNTVMLFSSTPLPCPQICS